MTSQQTPYPGDLALKLDRLFRIVHPPGEREYSSETVARMIGQRGGPTISGTYLWQLRTGIKDNPAKRHLESIAAFFEVSPSYFFDEELGERIASELELVAALRDSGVHGVALRAVGLSPRSIDAIRGMIESAREIEGLEDEEEPKRRRSDS